MSSYIKTAARRPRKPIPEPRLNIGGLYKDYYTNKDAENAIKLATNRAKRSSVVKKKKGHICPEHPLVVEHRLIANKW
jgi:hypothetical protein